MESESAGVVQSLEVGHPEDEPAPSSLSTETERETTSHHDEISNTDTVQKAEPVRQLCRFYSQGRRCYYGKRCRFLHQRAAAAAPAVNEAESSTDPKEDHREKVENADGQPSESSEKSQSGKEKQSIPTSRNTAPVKRERARRTCRYFLSGFCAMDNRCRFWHPEQLPPLEDQPPEKPKERSSFRPPAPRPAQEQAKLSDLTEEVCKQLRATEIAQMIKRFPKDNLIVQEREDGKLTYYRVTVQATDPDWPFNQNEIEIMVSFPQNYPQEVFTLDVPEDQDLPVLMCRHVQKVSEEWLKAKNATNQLMGRVELLFRPYLRWLDRSMEKLFTDGARQLKKDIDLERAGIQFVPYKQLKVTVFKNQGKKSNNPERIVSLGVASEEEEVEEQDEGVEEEDEEEEEEETALGTEGEAGDRQVENIKTRERRSGTEIKLLGLRLGEQTATVAAKQISVTLQCSRCKVNSDLTLNGRLPCTAHCEKCDAGTGPAPRGGQSGPGPPNQRLSPPWPHTT